MKHYGYKYINYNNILFRNKMVLSEKLANELTFFEIIIGIVVALILTAFWQRAIENFIFNTLGLNHKSTYHTFVAALALSVIFLVLINLIDDVARDIVLGTDTAGAATDQQMADLMDPFNIAVPENQNIVCQESNTNTFHVLSPAQKRVEYVKLGSSAERDTHNIYDCRGSHHRGPL